MKARLDRKAKNDHDEDDGYNKGGRVARASGGKVGGKGKTNITIVMAPGQGGSQGSPQAVPVPRPVPIPVQAPPAAAGPPPIGAGAPPVMPPGGPPMGMGRKAGGRVTVGKGLGMTAGGGSGEGRIQKAAMQKRTYP